MMLKYSCALAGHPGRDVQLGRLLQHRRGLRWHRCIAQHFICHQWQRVRAAALAVDTVGVWLVMLTPLLCFLSCPLTRCPRSRQPRVATNVLPLWLWTQSARLVLWCSSMAQVKEPVASLIAAGERCATSTSLSRAPREAATTWELQCNCQVCNSCTFKGLCFCAIYAASPAQQHCSGPAALAHRHVVMTVMQERWASGPLLPRCKAQK